MRPGGTPPSIRVTTLKAGKDGGLIDYYVGLAADQLCRDGSKRGPVDYYLDPNEPPGRWWGQGYGAMELAGEVQPEQLAALLDGCHPGDGCRLGRGFGARSARGFDDTFSAPKSASMLWALSPDPWVRAEVLAAHDTAVVVALDWFERHGAVTRRGTDGVDQVDTEGLVAALFRQHTSRSADPQLHTHAVISAEVQDRTGKWLSLDARFLKGQHRSISWVYASALRSELTARLGLSWDLVREGHAEINDVPEDLVKLFSQRAEQVEAKVAELIGAWVDEHDGAEPDARTIYRLERAAVLASRRASRRRLRPTPCGRSGRSEPGRLASSRCLCLTVRAGCRGVAPSTSRPWSPTPSTRSRRRRRPGCGPTSPGRSPPSCRQRRAGRPLKRLSWWTVWRRPPPPAAPSSTRAGTRDSAPQGRPAAERAPHRPSPHDSGGTGPGRPPARLGAVRRRGDAACLRGSPGRRRSGGERERPPGAGGGARRRRQDHNARGSRIGPAPARPAGDRPCPSGKAADVLAHETGWSATTLAKLLHEHARPGGPAPPWGLPVGTTVVLDEAGMAATEDLDALVGLVQRHRWRLVCVGDPAQLPTLGRGGMFAHWCEILPAHHLEEVRASLTHGRPKPSLALRRGDRAAAVAYAARHRLQAIGWVTFSHSFNNRILLYGL